MITILNRPYDGLTTKINPVYNGLGFVVNSDKKLITNFKYIAEIYVNSGKIGELRHNPDISANNYGQFDFGRVIENYISYDIAPTIPSTSISNMSNSLVPYYIRFGEEFSRIGSMTSVISYSGATYTGKLRITVSGTHNLETGDRVLLQGLSVSGYNTWSKVYKINSNSFIATDITYTTPTNVNDAYFISGEEITLWSSYVGSDGANYLQIRTKLNSSFNVGDMIQVRQDRKNTSGTTVAVVNSQYENTEWTITSKINSSTYTTLKTNIPYGAAVASNIYGSIISRNNFVIYNLLSTQNDGSWAWNGTKQWDEVLSWTPSPYIFTSSSSHFLTSNPNKEMNVCLSDYFTLPYWGLNIIKTADATNYASNKIRIETWSNPPASPTYAATSIASDSTITSTRLRVQYAGANITSVMTAGSPITFTHSGGSISGTILRSYYSGTTTYVITDIAYSAYTGPNSITIIKQVRRYDRTPANLMGQIGVGPANLNFTEINDGSCYEYKVFAIKYGANNYLYTIKGETWTFTLADCNCKPNIKLVWLNELGGFDYFTFDGRVDKVRNIEKSNFKRKLKSYKSGSGYTFTYGDRGLTTYNTQSFDVWTARTRFLTQSELNWLSYIYDSTEVYILKDNATLLPITLTNTDAQLFDKNNVGDMGRLYYYTIEFRPSNDRVIQRG